VDIETSGPIPGDYDLLSIGMCLVDKPTVNFYCELKPISNKYDPEALSVTGFNLDILSSTGLLANVAMAECLSGLIKMLQPTKYLYLLGLTLDLIGHL
jgi:hypothetical protein